MQTALSYDRPVMVFLVNGMPVALEYYTTDGMIQRQHFLEQHHDVASRILELEEPAGPRPRQVHAQGVDSVSLRSSIVEQIGLSWDDLYDYHLVGADLSLAMGPIDNLLGQLTTSLQVVA